MFIYTTTYYVYRWLANFHGLHMVIESYDSELTLLGASIMMK